MNAASLIKQLEGIAKKHNVKLKDLEVNYRVDYNSDVREINCVNEDLYDEKTNTILESITLCENGDIFGEKMKNKKVSKRISDLKEEYEQIRNYQYDKYDDEFEAVERKSEIETVFSLLKIKFKKFDR